VRSKEVFSVPTATVDPKKSLFPNTHTDIIKCFYDSHEIN